MKKVFENSFNVINGLFKGQMGVYIVVRSSQDNKLLAGGRGYMGRIEKVTVVENARIGCAYENKVSAMADEKFVPQARRGFTWLQYPIFEISDKKQETYVTFNYRPCDTRTKFNSCYLLDGRLATDAEVEEFKQYFKKSGSYSKTQAAVGITNEEEQTKVVRYRINDIAYVGTNKGDAYRIYEEQQE